MIIILIRNWGFVEYESTYCLYILYKVSVVVASLILCSIIFIYYIGYNKILELFIFDVDLVSKKDYTKITN